MAILVEVTGPSGPKDGRRERKLVDPTYFVYYYSLTNDVTRG